MQQYTARARESGVVALHPLHQRGLANAGAAAAGGLAALWTAQRSAVLSAGAATDTQQGATNQRSVARRSPRRGRTVGIGGGAALPTRRRGLTCGGPARKGS